MGKTCSTIVSRTAGKLNLTSAGGATAKKAREEKAMGTKKSNSDSKKSK